MKFLKNSKTADCEFRFLCESLLGEDIEVKFRNYFVSLGYFEVFKVFQK